MKRILSGKDNEPCEYKVLETNNYKVSNMSELNNFVRNITIGFSYAAPNFTVYDNLLQNWTYDYAIINKRSIETLSAQAELIDFWKENRDFKKSGSWFYNLMDDISESVSTFFDSLGNWFNTLFIKYLVVPVVTLLCVYLLCIRVKRGSSPIVTECK